MNSGRGRAIAAVVGQETRAEAVRAPIPAGTAGWRARSRAGEGNAGVGGGPPGDLYVTVHVAPHPAFRRDGDDLHTVVPIAVHEAGLGARVEIETPDGAARLRCLPAPSRDSGSGSASAAPPSRLNGRRGDLVVEMRLMLPKLLDERSKELLREFGRINSDMRRK